MIGAVKDDVHQDVVGAAAPLLPFRVDVFDDIRSSELCRPRGREFLDIGGNLIERELGPYSRRLRITTNAAEEEPLCADDVGVDLDRFFRRLRERAEMLRF